MASNLRIKDRGARDYRQVRQQLSQSVAIDVGIDKHRGSEKHPNSDLTVAEVATINELGLGVPRRSFLRDWFEESATSIQAQISAAGRLAYVRKLPLGKAADKLGGQYVRQIRARIERGVPPPNAPSTIAQKGSATPLIDTRTLFEAISHEVRRVRR